jgi:HlyD family secretion protein
VKKVLIVSAVVIVIALLVIVNIKREGSKVEVEVTEVKKRNITKVVTASGRIQPKRKVNVSASSIGKITKLSVKEGDRVKKGDFLLQIDPTDYQSVVDQLEASIRAAQATLDMEQANLRKSEIDLERAQTLREADVVSDEELRTARLNVEVFQARVKSAREGLAQHRANLKSAAHDLSEVRIVAEMSGIITELNVEEGENAIMGTLNNPGTVLLTIADLSDIEAEVEVDETEVVFMEVGQTAVVNLDAYPDSSFAGVVTEVGNSAIRTSVGLGQSSVDFKVVIAVKDVIPNVRPGLSCNARVEVAKEESVLSVPIQCLTVRKRSDLEGSAAESSGDDEETAEVGEDETTDDDDVEGVFVLDGGKVTYRAVKLGIAGSIYFHVKDGLAEGDVVVKGPFKAINELEDGDPVKSKEKTPEKK